MTRFHPRVRNGGTHEPLRLAFLGSGFIARVHSRHLRALRGTWRAGYASRDGGRAEALRSRYRGASAYHGYDAALSDPAVDAVVVAVPPRLHVDLVLAAIERGKHVLVEKPAFVDVEDYDRVARARDRRGVCVLVGENDHYKPLAITLRRLLREDVIGDLLMANFTTVAHRPKAAGDWRHDPELAGGDAFFEEGVHWLHLANSLGPRITRISGHRPRAGGAEPSGRRSTQLVAFEYDTGSVGALFYSREVPSLMRGLRVSKLYGRRGVISFESNGAAVLVHTRGCPRMILPGWRDVRGYQAMYADFAEAIRQHRPPQMSVERAREDHVLAEQVRRG